MKTIYDNADRIDRADDRVVLKEDDNGHLYETTNAATDELVSSAMFAGWNIEAEPRRTQWLNELEKHFGSRDVAERYYRAAIDADK